MCEQNRNCSEEVSECIFEPSETLVQGVRKEVINTRAPKLAVWAHCLL